jgi:hypothetical protein
MFDYQAGEKYKLTLIMVGVAGLIAGMFFTLLLMPTPDAAAAKQARAAARMTRANMDPDVVGSRGGGNAYTQGQAMAGAAIANGTGAGSGPMPAAADMVDRFKAQELMQSFLPLVWDLNARTALSNQEEAIKWMTPDCAAAYRANVWTPDMANKITSSGLQSQFTIKDIQVSQNLSDGSVVATVHGNQILVAPAGTKQKEVNLEYMLKQTPEGIRVAGISEATAH